MLAHYARHKTLPMLTLVPRRAIVREYCLRRGRASVGGNRMAIPMPTPGHGRPEPRPSRQHDPSVHPSQSPTGRPAPAPTPRPSTGASGGSGGEGTRKSGGGGRGDYGDLAALMNNLLGSIPQESLSSSGPLSTLVAESITQFDVEPFLASMFWSQFVRNQFYRRLTARFHASDRSSLIVVGHADATRYDLLLLDSEYRGEPRGELIESANSAIRETPLDPQMIRRVLRRVGSLSNLEPRLISGSVNEVAENREFGVAIARAPEQLSTFSVSPALAVRDGRQESVATIGVIAKRDSGIVVATTANHAVSNVARRLTVDRTSLVIIGRHQASDSCLLAIHDHSCNGLRRYGIAGPLRGVPPAPYSPAKFDGATSGFISTMVTAFDLSIIDPQMDEMSKIYTTPDTAPGDSGAALADSEDRILGLAYRRSRYDSQMQFSAWVWAEQVCIAHGLFGCVDLNARVGHAG